MVQRDGKQVPEERGEGGTGVDKYGNPVIDPTKNVRELVDAAIQRQDDLRKASELRADDLRKASERRIDELNIAERKRIDDISELRAAHSYALREAETKRIDAIRAVDVAAVAIATERATAQATVLANQVAQSAETLRALVATTATASSVQADAAFKQLSDRITLLERGQYEGAGKSAVADPMMARMVSTLEEMKISLATDFGRGGGLKDGWGYLVGFIGAAVAIVTTIMSQVGN